MLADVPSMPNERMLASLLAALGMVGLGALVWALDEYGPRSRVVYLPYLPLSGEAAHVLVAGAVGLSLSADVGSRLGRGDAPYRPFRLAVGCSLGGFVGSVLGAIAAAVGHGRRGGSDTLGLATLLAVTTLGAFSGAFIAFKRAEGAPGKSAASIAVRGVIASALAAWVVVRQLDAFPSHADVAVRDAWARAHVREYPGLVRFASGLPVVIGDLEKVVAVAPTGTETQIYASDMDGDAMRFTLEMVGETGRGTLWVDATFTEGKLFAWRGGRWTFRGLTTPIEVRTDRLPPPR